MMIPKNSPYRERVDFEYESEWEWEWADELERESGISSKDYIKWVQRSLNRIMQAGLKVNGRVSTKYRTAVKRFNERYVNKRTDGNVDRRTQDALIKENEKDRDYIRWVQRALNKILSLRLVVDGQKGSRTRSALRSFQRRSRLTVDGFVGAKTELGFIQAGGGLPPGYTAPRPRRSGVDQQMKEVLDYIRRRANRAASRRLSLSNRNRFARVVRSRYLTEYLAAPTKATASAAINAISQQNTSGRVTMVCGKRDYWEQNTPAWNGLQIPAVIRRVPGLGWLPASFGAATEILTVANRRSLSHIDVPFLLGRRTFDELDCSTQAARGQDPDFMPNNSINTSQLMHWATGVRYSHFGRDRLRELFLAYELWHLEHWDVFGQDPINDMIAEDAARHMAVQIRALRLNRRNYITTLNEGFMQARVWVGALLRQRRAELGRQISADPPPSAFIHWQKEVPPTSPFHPYRAPSVRQMLADGATVAQVKASPLVRRYIQVYTLVFEAEKW